MAASTMIDKVPFTHVELTEGLWLELMTTNRKVGVPFQYEQCLKTGRIDAFKLKEREGCGEIHIFWDSDVAKWIEAAAYSLAFQPDPELEEKVDGVIRDMEAARAVSPHHWPGLCRWRVGEPVDGCPRVGVAVPAIFVEQGSCGSRTRGAFAGSGIVAGGAVIPGGTGTSVILILEVQIM